MKIVLNEKEYAEECLRNNDVGDSPYFTLSILARYYYHHYGYRKKRIADHLTEFLKNSYQRYEVNISGWENTIEKIAANAGKYALFESDGVWITTEELSTIESLSDETLERLAFTLLCLAKYANAKNPLNNGWVKLNDKEVFRLARISCRVKERFNFFGQLRDLGLLEYPKRNDNLSCRVTYIKDKAENKILVSDFRELGYEYRKYKGENLSTCRECGILFFKTSKNQCYCSMCAADNSNIKRISCIDCGKVIEVARKNNRATRCKECQHVKETELNRLRKQKERAKE